MSLFSDFGKPENDPGKMFTYGNDEGQPVRFLIRHVPEYILKKMRSKYDQNKLKLKAGGGTEIDTELGRSFSRAKAAYALLGSDNATINLRDEAATALWSDMTGQSDIPIGVFKIDGHWNDAVRDRFLRINPEVVDWINEKLDDEIKKTSAEDEVAEKN